MTRFSLKRTLQSDLATTIEVLNHINPDKTQLNLRTPLKHSAVLLSIGKITNICHQDIPLKNVYCNRSITYISAIPLKLKCIWKKSAGEIASTLLSVLQTQMTPNLWASVYKTDQDWIKFVITQYGIDQWRQQLIQRKFPITVQLSCPIESETLWQLQSGYELCCRWRACYQQLKTPDLSPSYMPKEPFFIPFYPLQELIHCLLDICDDWDHLAPSRLLQQAKRLVLALQHCSSVIRLTTIEAATVNYWLKPTQIVLKQLLEEKLDYSLATQF